MSKRIFIWGLFTLTFPRRSRLVKWPRPLLPSSTMKVAATVYTLSVDYAESIAPCERLRKFHSSIVMVADQLGSRNTPVRSGAGRRDAASRREVDTEKWSRNAAWREERQVPSWYRKGIDSFLEIDRSSRVTIFVGDLLSMWIPLEAQEQHN